MAGVLKKATKFAGLPVSQRPHHEITVLYGKILRILVTFPKDAAYRRHTEKLVRERNEIVLQNPSVAAIEEKIGCGEIEELIIQAKYELTLAQNMRIWKPWERMVEEPPKHQWTWPPHK